MPRVVGYLTLTDKISQYQGVKKISSNQKVVKGRKGIAMNSSLRLKKLIKGDIMRNSGILLILSVMVLSSLAHATLAICPSCKGDQPDWDASATAFLEGKPINDTPSGLNGPQHARLIDAQIDSKKSPGQAPNAVSNPAVTPTYTTTPILNIVLNDIRAVPNPANFSDPVMITAVFGNNSSVNATPNDLSTNTELTNMVVYANIKNSAGIEVGRVNLKRTSGNQYAGIWTANVDSGDYKATIDAFGSGASKAFNDALQIKVIASKNTASNIPAIRNLG